MDLEHMASEYTHKACENARIDNELFEICFKLIREAYLAGASVREASETSSDAVSGTTAIEETAKLLYHIE